MAGNGRKIITENLDTAFKQLKKGEIIQGKLPKSAGRFTGGYAFRSDSLLTKQEQSQVHYGELEKRRNLKNTTEFKHHITNPVSLASSDKIKERTDRMKRTAANLLKENALKIKKIKDAHYKEVEANKNLEKQYVIKEENKITGMKREGASVFSGQFFADIKLKDPAIRNPLLNITNFYLPQDPGTMNQWIRYYDRFHPLVGNSMDLHAFVPFSKFQFTKVEDNEILKFYQEMSNEMDLLTRIFELSREYELIGECIPFAHWSEENNAFDRITILNPDFVDIIGVRLPDGTNTVRVELIPDPDLKTIVKQMQGSETDAYLLDAIDPQ